MRSHRLLVAALAAAALVVPTAASAQAAPPGNDTPAGATVVSTLPTTITESTTQATTDDLDAALNESCGAPVTNGSVWFKYTDTAGAGFVVDVSQSDFPAGVMIIEGDPTAGGSFVSCYSGATGTRGAPGTVYYVMAFSDTPDVVGGKLVATFSKAPAPTAALTVSPRATAFKNGSLRLTGTYSCTNADYGSGIEGKVVQQVGRLKITGYVGVYELQCDGTVQPWEAYVTSDTGLFGGGKAATATVAYACDLVDCTSAPVVQKVKISRNGK